MLDIITTTVFPYDIRPEIEADPVSLRGKEGASITHEVRHLLPYIDSQLAVG